MSSLLDTELHSRIRALSSADWQAYLSDLMKRTGGAIPMSSYLDLRDLRNSRRIRPLIDLSISRKIAGDVFSTSFESLFGSATAAVGHQGLVGTVKKPTRVFFSYNRLDLADVDIVRKCCEGISGLEVLFDFKNLPPGQPVEETIESLMRSSDKVAVFLGPHGFGNFQRQKEILSAKRIMRDIGKTVVPCLLPGCVLDDYKTDPEILWVFDFMWIDFSFLRRDEVQLRAECEKLR